MGTMDFTFKEFMLKAIKFLYPELDNLVSIDCSNKEIMMYVVQEIGSFLRLASRKLKSDRDIVLNAVKCDGVSLEFATHDLKNDREIALHEIKQNGLALEFVSTELKGKKNWY
ncbi:hypothetical protein FDP41_006046 [Naegleria fowleri]|uniref:DUF4116 domain-containing protein n=1 Tax=Naegleria fowleri TaxID=5763 RepID=A0A6A5BKQ0_NAEFO|nr:uncharacterized protein FDP41_006046 [Naegleria fowleri]KAF0974941.1 hypothetical protein FDP41_006046 [Naegleria fowleri]